MCFIEIATKCAHASVYNQCHLNIISLTFYIDV